MKNIFISAYACDPYGDSEYIVGWKILNSMAENSRDYNFIVATQKHDHKFNTEDNIRKYLTQNSISGNITFHFFDFPIRRIRYTTPVGHYIYYWLWQRKLITEYEILNKKYNFDLVHHLTFVTINQPTYLYKCNKKFIWGPLGGGEYIPDNLLKNIGIENCLFERLRCFLVKIKKYNSYFRKCAKAANKIVVVNNDTLKCFAGVDQEKLEVVTAIGYNEPLENSSSHEKRITEKGLRIVTVGVLYYRKGIDLVLKIIKRLFDSGIEVKLDLIGEGPGRIKYEQWVKENGLEKVVNFLGSRSHNEVLKHMRESDLMLFPSRRDSGGFVVVEAIQNNTPVICLDLGGPGETVRLDSSFGWAINPLLEEDKIVETAFNIIKSHDFKTHRVNSKILDNEYLWSNKAQKLLKLYEQVI